MADNSKIEWTDATVNFWWGCTKVGPGCDHCYAETWSRRTGENIWGPGVPRRAIKSAFPTLAKLNASAARFIAENGRNRRVFIQSMSDLFDKEVPLEWFATAWGAIWSANAMDVQIVTKRLSMIEKRLAGRAWPRHAGLLISLVNQEEADRDIPRLIALKKKLGIPWIGLSMEPLLGLIVLRPEWLAELDWIIVGGESGPHARPLHPDWARSLCQQCMDAGVPFFFKQWGEWLPGEIYHPNSDRTSFSVHWQNGEEEYNGEHIDFTTETIDVHHAPGCPYEASLAEQQKARGYAEERIARALVANCGRGRCRDAGYCRSDELPWHTVARRVGKKAAGRLLDGVEHSAFPRGVA